MSKSLSDAPLRPDEQLTTPEKKPAQALKDKQPAVFWPWLGGLLLVGLVIVLVVTFATSNWLTGLQHSSGGGPASRTSTVNVQRSTVYNDLNVTLLNVQYATSFSDDLIHLGPAIVRVNLRVTNSTKNVLGIAYYDVARLLVSKQQALAPTNLTLSASLQAGSTQDGWMDFPVAKNTTLNTLSLQFGDTTLGGTLVTIPVSGPYAAGQYDDHLYKMSVNINYFFVVYQRPPGHWLNYHLKSVATSYSYQGIEAKAGDQYYVLSFTVDNPNGVVVSPGFGYDYMRFNNRTAQDNSLPQGFNPNAHNVSGYVVFLAPANAHSFTLSFLYQSRPGSDPYPITF
jgi:hypothetical protein